MKKFAFLLGLIALFLIAPNIRGYTQDLYYYNSSITAPDFSMTGYANITSDTETCNTTLEVFADITGGTGKSVEFFLYNNGTQLGSPVVYSSNANTTCQFMLNQTVSGGIVDARARVVNLGNPISTNLYLEIHTNCQLVSNATIYITDNFTYGDTGSQNMYQQTAIAIGFITPLNDTLTAWNDIPPAHCSLTNKSISSYPYALHDGNHSMVWFLPFNSGLGNVNFSGVIYTSGMGGTAAMGILNLNNMALTGLINITYPTTQINFDLNATLQPFTNYVAWMWDYVPNIAFYKPQLNITLTDYEANYSCNSTICMNGTMTGTRTVTCVDTGGLAPNLIYPQSCLGLNETTYLGFEDSTPQLAQYCTKTLYPVCYDTLANIKVFYPYNPQWTIFPSNVLGMLTENFATITGETATRGFQSLKLWVIPPSPPLQPVFQTVGNVTSVICGNLTSSSVPQTYLGGLNATFFVQYNYTFPSSTMHLMFDVKKCPTPVVQYDGWCGKSCYGFVGNCTFEPRGDYFVQLFDDTNSSQTLLYASQSVNNWTNIDIDLSNNPNILDHTYTITIGVGGIPFDFNSPYSWCSYFDNVRLFNAQTSSLEETCLNLYGKPCSDLTTAELQNAQNVNCPTISRCEGVNLHTRNIQNNICVDSITPNETNCYTQNQQQQAQGNQSIFQCIGSVCNTIVNSTTNQTLGDSVKASGWGFMLFFLTPIFWLMLLAVILPMSIVSYFTRHMEIGAGVGVLMLVGLTVYFPELLFITIVTVVIVGYIVGRSIVQAVRGG